MQADLTFRDPGLEVCFQEHHAAEQKNLEEHFHIARALAWAAVGIRAIIARQWQAAVITWLGAITTILPAFTHRIKWRGGYVRWRPLVIIADNILQVALGCYTHDAIYPPIETGSWRSVFVLLSGNGVAWLLFSGLWGSLVFRYMFPQQAVLVIIILLFNRTLCGRNAALVQAYHSLKAAAGLLLKAVVPSGLTAAALELLRTFGEGAGAGGAATSEQGAGSAAAAAAVAAVGAAGGAGPADVCSGTGLHADWLVSCITGVGVAGPGHPPCQCLLDGESLCMLMQPITLLVCGFLLPTFYIYVTELRARHRFARTAESRGLTTLRWLPVHELGPSPIDYFLFGVPALACLYCYVIAIS